GIRLSSGDARQLCPTRGELDVNAPAAPVIKVSGLSVDRGGQRVLHDVDLRVEAGELVALLGANGSGKSTLLRAVVGVLPPATGTARLFGRPVQQGTSHDRLGYVPQETSETGSIPATAREDRKSVVQGKSGELV